jgi:membrane fusion protein, copper/silver efflux system
MRTEIRHRLYWIAPALILAVVAAVTGARYLGNRGAPEPAAKAQSARIRYHCPMHPAMISDHPGDCPICGMRMVPLEGEPPQDNAPSVPSTPPAGPGKIIYRSTMIPGEVSDKPGKDSMGMEMVPVEVESSPSAGQSAPGLAAVNIPERKQQLIGVRTAIVQRSPFLRKIRTVGTVAVDETRLYHVHTKVDGWIDSLSVNATGEKVRKGQRLLSLYSPELLATQEEYLVALKALRDLKGTSLPEALARAEDLVESGRRRLLLYDLTPAQIQALESAGKPSRSVELFSPVSGYVLQRNVTDGQKIGSDQNLLDIADLSRVWVLASVYEYELPFIRVGQSATMTLSYLPGRSFRGSVALVYPVLEGSTRTVQIRLEFDNPGLELKPDMYADVELQSDLGRRLTVPTGAILSTGKRDLVFVALGDGYFQPREVRLGLRLPEEVEVLEGVKEGEKVVTSGNFLIDSESKLKAALADIGDAGAGPEAGRKAPPAKEP